MQKVILCDDDEFTLQIESKYLQELSNLGQLKFEVVAQLRSYQELMTFLKKSPEHYLFFMDLDFGSNQVNGLDISHMIRKYDSKAKIVFVTSHSEEVFAVLKSGIEPFGFIEKTTNSQKMLAEFAHYLTLAVGEEKESVSVKTEKNEGIKIPIGIDEYVNLPYEKITYIETASEKPHHIFFHTLDKSKVLIRWNLADVETKLPDNFLRTHRSTIVNINYVIGLKLRYLNLATGETIPVSRKYAKTIKEELKAIEK